MNSERVSLGSVEIHVLIKLNEFKINYSLHLNNKWQLWLTINITIIHYLIAQIHFQNYFKD